MTPLGATLLRLGLGAVFVMHAYLALFVVTPGGVAALNTRIDLPAPELMAWYLIAAHGLGGLMLVLGLWARWAALANVPVMLWAAYLVHGGQGFFMKAVALPSGQHVAGGYEFTLTLLVATLAQVFLGGGALAVTRERAY